MYLELEAEVLFFNFVDDLPYFLSMCMITRLISVFQHTFSCSLKVITFPWSVRTPATSLLGNAASGVD